MAPKMVQFYKNMGCVLQYLFQAFQIDAESLNLETSSKIRFYKLYRAIWVRGENIEQKVKREAEHRKLVSMQNI